MPAWKVVNSPDTRSRRPSLNPTHSHIGAPCTSGVVLEYVEALPVLRLMSGSNDLMTLERGLLAAVVENISDDGMIFHCASVRGGTSPPRILAKSERSYGQD